MRKWTALGLAPLRWRVLRRSIATSLRVWVRARWTSRLQLSSWWLICKLLIASLCNVNECEAQTGHCSGTAVFSWHWHDSRPRGSPILDSPIARSFHNAFVSNPRTIPNANTRCEKPCTACTKRLHRSWHFALTVDTLSPAAVRGQ